MITLEQLIATIIVAFLIYTAYRLCGGKSLIIKDKNTKF
jgi:hypothetical protein